MIDYTDTSLHFKLGTEIGSEGRNSRVFVAHDYQLDTDIVVKQIQKAAFSHPDEFFNEAKILYVSSHSNIVPIQYSTQDADHIYISMPYYKKGSLNGIIDKRFLSLKEILKYSLDFLSGLHHIHTLNLIHFDVKPTNILLSDNGDALLTDFGLAKYLDLTGVTSIDMAYGLHRAPEVLLKAEATHQTDIYQAGLTIYRLCNGNQYLYDQYVQYAGDSAKLINDTLKGKFPDRTCLDHIPRALKKVIKCALEPDPDNRYQSVLDMMNDLANIDVPFNWIFNPNAGSLEWECDCEDRKISIKKAPVGADNCHVTTTKTLKSSGNTQRMTAYCKNNVKNKEGRDLIYSILQNKNL